MSRKHAQTSYARRCKVAATLFETPMSTANLAAHLKCDDKKISNDVGWLVKNRYVVASGRELYTSCNGQARTRLVWKATRLFGDGTVMVDDTEPNTLPDLPDNLLLMMGYTKHEPKGGVFVDNEDFRPEYTLSKHRVCIPSTMGMFESFAA